MYCINGKLTNICYIAYTGAKIPRKGPEAKEYEAKWTTACQGQVPYGGWKEGAHEAYNEWLKAMAKLRKDDAKNGKQRQRYALKIMRELHEIPDNQKVAPEPNSNNNKKRPAKDPVEIDPKNRKVITVDEEE